jgi:murein DD-endopeptidase MepM/ murein hydrolase activator NlpD
VTAATRRRMRVATVGLIVLLPGAAASAEPVARATVGQRWHEVRPGDTLSAISRRYGVSLAALVAANRLGAGGARLRVGQRLVVPGPAPDGRPGEPGAVAGGVRGPQVPARPRARGAEAWRLRAPSDLVLALPDFADLGPPFAWPLDGRISSAFGLRRGGWHGGIDIRADAGAPVTASLAGIVVASRWEPQYGRVIKIEHRGGFTTTYAHNAENLVDIGDHVIAGQRIARVGRSGRATAEHLHFEIRRGGLAYNPLFFLPLPPRAGLGEAADVPLDHE